MLLYRYSRWDGAQQPFPLHEDELIEQLADSLMSHGDVGLALRAMTQRGVQGREGQHLAGVQELLQRLQARRKEYLDQYDLGSVLEELQERLAEVITTEREGIARRLQEVRQRAPERSGLEEATQEQLRQMLDQMAARNRDFLDNLPQDPAQAIEQLRTYEFMDPQAREKFRELLASLQRGLLDSHFRDLSQRLQGLTPQDLEQVKGLLRDLNDLLEQKLGGQEPNFQEFLNKHGQLLGPNPPRSLDELMEQMRQQTAYLESLLNSLSPQQRQQLRDLLSAALGDAELQEEMARLAAQLDRLSHLSPLGHAYSFGGEDSLTLDEALALMEQLQEMDKLERQLKRTQHGGNIGEVDTQLLEQALGEEAAQELERLKHLAELLEEGGYIRREGNHYELTPKGIRKIGGQALREIFAFIKRDRAGNHAIRRHGDGGELLEDTKQYEFGDPFSPHLNRTLMNAIRRGNGGVPLHIQPQDFEVHRQEQVTRSTTVLMLDLSLSMAMRGNFLAAKKVALALDNLVRTQFPRDTLYIVGFSTYAREVKPEKLPYLNWDEFDPYTNIQHGLSIAQKLLARTSGGTKQIVMISDGEPTAHIEAGHLFLQYPPSPRTIRETLREVKRCTSGGIVINTFMLDRNSYLVDFVDQMTRINRGRVFYTSPDRLGQYLLVDYYTHRRRLLA